MNYFELCGVPCSGKSFLKKKLIKEKKLFFDEPYELIIFFFIKKCRLKIKDYLKITFFLFIKLSCIQSLKKFKLKKRIVKKKNKNITFENYNQLKIGFLSIDKFYEEVLDRIDKKFNIKKKDKFYQFISRELDTIHQNKQFNLRYKRWIFENLVIIRILKNISKKKKITFIYDEGLVHKLFIIFSIHKDKKKFIKLSLKYFKPHGLTIFIDSNIKSIFKRSKKRKINGTGFIYNNLSQVKEELKNFKYFKKLITPHINFREN
tara:strand:- start:57 stop:842 length:786 start_codon:yes stop_codon:yes gene_type:complete